MKPFSVFLGPNGSGKTTFFDVIGFLSDCLTTNVRKALEKRGRFQEVISRDCPGQEIEISIKYREDNKSPKITYTVAIALQNGAPIVSRETLKWKRGSHGKPFDFLKFENGGGEVISGENPEINDKRIHYQMDDPSSLAIKTIGQLSDNPRIASLRRFIEEWLDEDRCDCQELKRKLCDASSVVTKQKGNIVLHRIAVEELESWFIGDVT
ncbi:MAG: AAA family ATPase [Nostoc sp.]